VGRHLTALLSVLAVATLSGCNEHEDVDRAGYVTDNVRLLELFPVPSGSRSMETVSKPWELSDGSYIAGYETTRIFFAPPRFDVRDLKRFYGGDIPGWRRTSAGGGATQRGVCYRGSLASVCVTWLLNLDPRPRRIPFHVAVDSRAYGHPETTGIG
jgi:hypothetical protein